MNESFSGILNTTAKTCHLNALLQVLYHLPLIRERVLTDPDDVSESVQEFKKLMRQLLRGGQSASAAEFINSLKFDPEFWQQEQDWSETLPVIERKMPPDSYQRIFAPCCVSWVETKFDASNVPVVSLDPVPPPPPPPPEHFIVLKLPETPSEKAINLVNLIYAENPFENSTTVLYPTATKTKMTKFTLLPQVLLLAVSRMSHSRDTGKNSLSEQKVNAPLQLPLTNDEQALILHSVLMYTRGHYRTYIRPGTLANLAEVYKNPPTDSLGEWISCNDSVVTSCTYEEIKEFLEMGTLYTYIRADQAREVMTSHRTYKMEQSLIDFQTVYEKLEWIEKPKISKENKLVTLKYRLLSAENQAIVSQSVKEQMNKTYLKQSFSDQTVAALENELFGERRYKFLLICSIILSLWFFSQVESTPDLRTIQKQLGKVQARFGDRMSRLYLVFLELFLFF
jgi:hypothetical protein